MKRVLLPTTIKRFYRGVEPLDILHETTRQYLGTVTIEDLLEKRGRKNLLTVTPTTTVQQTLDKMWSLKVGSVLITNGPEALGIFTDADFGRVLRDAHADWKKAVISEYMTQNVVTGSLDMSIRDAMLLLANNRIRHLPISNFHDVDNDARIVDVVSSRDFFNFLLN